MPLSFLTRLRGVLVVGIVVLCLLLVEVGQQVWISVAIFLVWMPVSSAVKDAPPFDDTAFHRTRPLTPLQVFGRIAGFHLLLLVAILASLAAYGWYYNVGIREIAIGASWLTVMWIAVVSLFGTVATLLTSTRHSKGWGLVVGIIAPALSTYAMFWFAFKASQGGGDSGFRPSLTGMGLGAALIYPALWWLVATKLTWRLGYGLALLVGASLPWVSPFLKVGESRYAPTETALQTQDLEFRRLATPVSADGHHPNQASVSHLIEIKGLAQDEFIIEDDLWMHLAPSTPGSNSQKTSDKVLNEMDGTAFATDSAGHLIPATAALYHTMGLGTARDADFPIWRTDQEDRSPDDDYRRKFRPITDLLRLRIRSTHDDNPSRNPLSPETARLTWEFSGSRHRWVKVLESSGSESRRARLPGGGVVKLTPPKAYPEDFDLSLQITIPRHCGRLWWRSPRPAVIARTSDGKIGLVDVVEAQGTPFFGQEGFLTRHTRLHFRQKLNHPQELAELRSARLEVYWPEYQGSFKVMLSPPE